MDKLIKYGDKNESVSLLQAHLNTLGYNLKVDGIFGKNTLKALNEWQGNTSTVFNVSTLELKMKLVRREFNKTNTIGDLYLNGQFFCNTLEDVNRDLNRNGVFDGDEKKVYAETAIPFGTYKVIINYSPKYKRLMPRLLNVPHFEGILIHSGNTEKDSAGCILVGKQSGQRLIESKDTFNRLFDKMKQYSNISIEIV